MRGQRGSKRPSSASSYTSTITTIVFITMCVLGVWMLTGNNLGPPRETAAKLLNDLRAQTTTAATKITNAATTTTTTRPFINANTNTDQQSNTVYEDNPGNLPEDAIQPDDPKKNENAEVVKEDGNSVVSKGGDLSVDEIFGNDGDKSEKGEEEEKQQVDKKKQVMTPKEKKNREKKREEEKIQQMKNLAAQIAEEEDKKQKAQQQQIQNQVNPRIQNQQNPLIPEQIQNQQEPLIPEVVQNQKNPELIQNQKNLINPELIQNQENPLNPEEIQNQVNPQMADEIQNQINPQMAEEIQNPQMTEEIQNQINPLQNQINPQMPEPIQNLENPQFTQNQEEMNTDLPAIQNKAQKRKQDRGKRNKPEKTTNMEEAAVKTGIPKESAESKNSWATQEKQSANEKERREDQSRDAESLYGYTWRLCNESAGADFIPCLDNTKALKKLRSTRHYEHRERHCPEEGPTCLVPIPRGYKRSITWPKSRDKVRPRI